ncbi:MAG: TonB-dependent receptor [Pseudomonadales bacterium]|nr:TonB-dependent receptor [Pseudomonadales bacterium]NIX08360.1 TonB-dependent receptor [Pseudomonadales bacterium]
MKKLFATALCCGLLAAPQLTFAEQGAIEEVIVTATRREESIQDVPIAVSAFSGEDLSARGVTDLYGLQEVSPSVSVYGSNSNSNGSSVRIRGIGTTGNNPGLEAAVGTFIDGVYRSRFGQAMADLVDVERIEILRGPQGTLFGKNTSAGAINIITKKPEFEQNGHVEVGGGELGTFKANASITGPMSETLAYRLAASYHERDGALENVDTGKEYDIRDRWSVKGQLLWEPSDDLSVRIIADYAERDENCCQSTWEFVSAGSRAAYLYADSNAFLDTSTRKAGANFDSFEDMEDRGVSMEIEYDIDRLGATLVSLTSFRDYEVYRGQDWDFTNVDIVAPPGQGINESFENWSQEFRLTGTAGRVDWLVGAYIYGEKLRTDERLAFGPAANDYLAALFTGTNPDSPLFDLILGIPLENNGYSADWATDTDGFAIFTHNVISLSDDWKLTLGLRYIDEEKDGEGVLNGVAPLPEDASANDVFLATAAGNEPPCLNPVFRAAVRSFCDNASWTRKRSDDAVTGTVSLGYAISDDQNVYVTYSRGFKAGGLNHDQEAFDTSGIALGGTEIGDGVEFEDETADAYEIGYKGKFLDGRMTVNAALFYTDFKDFQLNTFTGLGFIVGNPGDVRAQGVELETMWTVNDWLHLSLGYTYADSRYDNELEPGNENLEGRTLTQSPYDQASFSAFIDRELGSSGLRGFGNLNVSYRSTANTGSGLEKDKIQGGFTLFNAQLGFRTANERWEFKVYCTNCTDKEVNRVIYNQVLASSSRGTFLNDPRIVGASVRANF